MTLQEYYKFPEGSNVTMSFLPFWFCDNPNLSCPAKMDNAFAYYQGSYIPPLDTSNVTSMSYMFRNCSGLTLVDLSNWDTSKVTSMNGMFERCSNISILDMSKCDTSNVTNMNQMFYYANVNTFCAIDCSGISTKNQYPIYSTVSTFAIVNCGGFIGMKMSWDNGYGLKKCSMLTYESCINILNGLYDFTGNGETPNANQGVLKVHQNFLNLVGDEIRIGTDKGWTISV